MPASGPGSWMLAQLDIATRAHHLHADAPRLELLSGSVTREKYEAYLSAVYAFEAPVEARLQRTPGLDALVDLRVRLRAAVLLQDLTALGVRPADALATPAFIGVEQALGWMYVIERGRRMNGLLHRHLARRLAHVVGLAGDYLSASSPSGMRWQRFGHALDKVADSHVIVEQIINAAHRAYRTLRQTSPRVTAAQERLTA